MSSRLATRSRCDTGSKVMLPMCVPRLRTCALTEGGAPDALMTKRSISASVYGVTEFQERFNSSTQLEPFQLTIRPVLGAAGSDAFIAGFGGGIPPFAATSDCDTMVVWLPDSKTETKTREPSSLRASARGCLPEILNRLRVALRRVGRIGENLDRAARARDRVAAGDGPR